MKLFIREGCFCIEMHRIDTRNTLGGRITNTGLIQNSDFLNKGIMNCFVLTPLYWDINWSCMDKPSIIVPVKEKYKLFRCLLVRFVGFYLRWNHVSLSLSNKESHR